ncbi:MAG: radical SAM protein [Candidatus Margulisiibacteriota bacterium]
MIKIASLGPHLGEEPSISGTCGSGTIFFSGCNLRCVYCQNYQISQQGMGYEVRGMELADKMLDLQAKGCHNINLVSPSHVAPQVIEALKLAKARGLKIPIVYNTNGYDSPQILKMMKGWVDIYLPDIKYSSDENAFKYSGVKNYVERNRAAITEMFRQVGNLQLDENGIARWGIIVRHLVLPNDIAGSFESLKFLASLSRDIRVSIMAQYHPCHKASQYPELNRRINAAEYEKVIMWSAECGLRNILTQELESADIYMPDFNRERPFV